MNKLIILLIFSTLLLIAVPAMAVEITPVSHNGSPTEWCSLSVNSYIDNSARSYYISHAGDTFNYNFNWSNSFTGNMWLDIEGLYGGDIAGCYEDFGDGESDVNSSGQVLDSPLIIECNPSGNCDEIITSILNESAGTFDINAITNSTGYLGHVIFTYSYSTATPTPVSAQSISTNPAKIIFVGRAFPEAELAFHLLDKDYLDITIKELTANSRGDFFQELTNSINGEHTYAINIKDKDGNLGETKFFTYYIRNNETTYENNILFPPTIVINKSNFAPGETVVVSGYSGPGNELEVLLDNEVLHRQVLNDSGIYRIRIDNMNKLTLGNHKLQARQTDPTTRITSNLSQVKRFNVSSFAFSGIDFNEDAKVDIQDWSIFLSNWSSQDQQKNKLDDLNNDGKVDIGDFSIFLNSFKLVE